MPLREIQTIVRFKFTTIPLREIETIVRFKFTAIPLQEIETIPLLNLPLYRFEN